MEHVKWHVSNIPNTEGAKNSFSIEISQKGEVKWLLSMKFHFRFMQMTAHYVSNDFFFALIEVVSIGKKGEVCHHK